MPFRPTADAAAIVQAFRELPVSGWHVHGSDCRRTWFGVVDRSKASQREGKVNAVVRRAGGELVGHWVESPREQYEFWRTAD